MTHDTFRPLTTDRLVLRLVEEDDLEAIWSYRSRPEVRTWISGSLDHDVFRQRFVDWPAGLQQLAIVEDGRVVGDLMLVVQDAWAQGEVKNQAKKTQGLLGWTIHPDVTGRGIATEAVTELIRHSFDDLGLRRVVAECFADNEPSWRLMERIGMRRESHHVRSALHRDHGWKDELTYALLADEWRQDAAPNVVASITNR